MTAALSVPVDATVRAAGVLAHRSKLSDPQFDAIHAAAERGDNEILRREDVTVSTLTSLARKRLVVLEHQVTGLRKVIASGHITPLGWEAYRAETRRRVVAEQRANNTTAQVSVYADLDPFALISNQRELAIPF